MEQGDVIGIAVFFVLLFFTAFTSASETSIIAVSRLRLKRLSSGGSKPAKLVLKMLESPERFFGTILVANNIVNTLIASISTAAMISIIGDDGRGILFATLIATIFIIVSEVVAKTLAAKHSERLSLFLAGPVKVLMMALLPVVKIFEFITNFIINIISSKIQTKPSLVTEEEIRALIKISEEEDAQHKEKYKMLSRVFEFSDKVAANAMTLKDKIVAIDISSNFDSIIEKVLESGYSRIPVYKDTPDNIVGIVNMKDLLSLAVNKDLVVLQDIIYPAVFVPGSKKIKELLKEFQKGHTHLAIVTDENNRLAGIITLEDLLEEIVGEIEDEHDIRTVKHKSPPKDKPPAR